MKKAWIDGYDETIYRIKVIYEYDGITEEHDGSVKVTSHGHLYGYFNGDGKEFTEQPSWNPIYRHDEFDRAIDWVKSEADEDVRELEGFGCTVRVEEEDDRYALDRFDKSSRRKGNKMRKRAQIDYDAINELIDAAENECISYGELAEAEDILREMRDMGMKDDPYYFELANACFGMDPFEDEDYAASKVSMKRTAKRIKRAGWRGHPDIEMRYYNEWADPDLLYKDYVFNYWDIEDALWDFFLEEEGIDESEAYDDRYNIKPEWEDKYNRYVQDYASYYLDDLIWTGAPKTWHESKKGKGLCKRSKNMAMSERKAFEAGFKAAMGRRKCSRRRTKTSAWYDADTRIFMGDPNYASVGKWVDLPADEDTFDWVMRYIASQMGDDNRDGEYIIADWEGFPPSVGDLTYASAEECSRIAEQIDELRSSHLPDEVVDILFDIYDDIDDVVRYADDVYYIEADTDAELAENYIDEMGGIEYMDSETLQRYFDYDAFGRDLSFDFYQGDGYYVLTAARRRKVCYILKHNGVNYVIRKRGGKCRADIVSPRNAKYSKRKVSRTRKRAFAFTEWDSPEHRNSFIIAYDAIKNLAQSQGLYSRLLAEMEAADWEPLYEMTRGQHFRDALDFIMFYEC